MGAVVEGCPSGIELDESIIQVALDRRRPGVIAGTSPRQEPDRVQILSGVHQGKTIGTPIALCIFNQDAKPKDYTPIENIYRPGHADFTYNAKYKVPLPSGGGRASARETVSRVAAGAIATQMLKSFLPGFEALAYVDRVHDIQAPTLDLDALTRANIEAHPMRCPDEVTAEKMLDFVQVIQKKGDSAGGVIACLIRGIPVGLGEPIFDKVEAELAKAMLSIPSVKGFEIGNGFSSTHLKGSENNDPWIIKDGKICGSSNRSGGVLGGITTGMPIFFRTAFKPPSTIRKTQSTVTHDGNAVQFEGTGRHDACVLPRAVPIVEAMAAIVLADLYLRAHRYP
jgi:chorismate synthase